MRQRIQQLLRMVAGYSVATLAGPLFTIVLTPIYTRVLQPADYAILDTTTTLGVLLFSLGLLGQNTAATALFHGEHAEHGRQVMSTAALLAIGWSLLVAAVAFAVARPLAIFSLGSAEQEPLLWLSAANLPVAVFSSLAQTGMQLRMEVRRVTSLALLNIVLQPLLIILFVVVLGWGVLGVQISIVIVTVLMASITAWLTRRSWGKPQRQLVGPLVRAGIAYLPGSLSVWGLAYVDRLLLPAFGVLLADRGLYAIANKLASMLAVVTVPFQNAWAPLALSMRDDTQAEGTYARVLSYFVVTSLGLGLGLGLFAREILQIFTTSAYVAAAPYVGLLSYVAVANGAGVALSVGCLLARRTAPIGWASAAGAATNLLLNLLLIPRFGVWGAVIATACGYLVSPVMLYVAAQRAHPIPYTPRKLLGAMAIQLLLLIVGIQLQSGLFWSDLLLNLGLLLAYLAAIVLLRIVSLAELRAILQLIRRPKTALMAKDL